MHSDPQHHLPSMFSYWCVFTYTTLNTKLQMCDREDPASQGHVDVFNEGQGCEDSRETKLQR